MLYFHLLTCKMRIIKMAHPPRLIRKIKWVNICKAFRTSSCIWPTKYVLTIIITEFFLSTLIHVPRLPYLKKILCRPFLSLLLKSQQYPLPFFFIIFSNKVPFFLPGFSTRCNAFLNTTLSPSYFLVNFLLSTHWCLLSGSFRLSKCPITCFNSIYHSIYHSCNFTFICTTLWWMPIH